MICVSLRVLPFTADPEARFDAWRAQGIRISTHDLRIASTCAAAGATLISRNRKDFIRIKELNVEFWN